jgi:hypothetical protein
VRCQREQESKGGSDDAHPQAQIGKYYFLSEMDVIGSMCVDGSGGGQQYAAEKIKIRTAATELG